MSSQVRLPAEWEKHEATWIGWPHNSSDWPGKLSAVQWDYVEIVRKLSEGEQVKIVVENAAHEKRAKTFLKKAGIDFSKIAFYRCRTDRGWTRDSGPIYVRNGKSLRIPKFRFNAWAKYPNWKKDVKLTEFISKKDSITLDPVIHNGVPVVLEGGAIDSNGEGTLLTTEECLLHPKIQVRNPGFSKEDYEAVFKKYLGIEQVLWLGNGIVGDDTHGHVDDLCRFVNPNTVVLIEESNEKDDNFVALKENRERLEGVTLHNGARLEIVPLPMPAPLYFSGHRLPASYANFYISNAAVLVPTFNDPNDQKAIGILSELFTDRKVVGIHAADLVWGFGTLHCLTHEQPLA